MKKSDKIIAIVAVVILIFICMIAATGCTTKSNDNNRSGYAFFNWNTEEWDYYYDLTEDEIAALSTQYAKKEEETIIYEDIIYEDIIYEDIIYEDIIH